jgi:hypothetical protein
MVRAGRGLLRRIHLVEVVVEKALASAETLATSAMTADNGVCPR